MSSWESVWFSRNDRSGGSSLGRALTLDGFDVGAGQVAEAEWIDFVREVAAQAGYGPHDSIIELGCGAGAMLLGLDAVNAGMSQIGLDYSHDLLDYAKHFLPSASFILADLREGLPMLPMVNHVLVHSVLQYLSVDEAISLIQQSFPLASNTISCLDIPNNALRLQSEEMRRLARPKGEYDSAYLNLVHTYFDYELFESLTPVGWRLEWLDMRLHNYANAQYRFSLVYRKLDSLPRDLSTLGR